MPHSVNGIAQQDSTERLRACVDYYSTGTLHFVSHTHVHDREDEQTRQRWKIVVEAGNIDYPASPEELEGEQVFILPRPVKVILWVVASLLTLVEDVFSKKDHNEPWSDLRQSPWPPAEDLEQGSSVHTAWAKAFEEWLLMQEEDIQQGRWQRSPRDPTLPRTSRRNHNKAKSSRDCHLEKREMRVRDLGLGYDSDEIVLFRYCVGTCYSSRKNYDLALKALMSNRRISSRKVSSQPCCRPTRYETVSFMDAQTTWQTIKWLSAANCSCVG